MKNVVLLTMAILGCFYTSNVNSQITFQDVKGVWGLPNTYNTNGASFNDFNNDGYPDLMILDYFGSRLYQNNQSNSFIKVDSTIILSAGQYHYSVQMGDYDHDGDLDIAIAGEGGGSNLSNLRLYRNNGTYFEDVTTASGLSTTYRIYSIAWIDYNNDGFLDLFCAGIVNSSLFYLNNGNGSFTNKTSAYGLSGYSANARGLAVGDYDNDGFVDVYVPNCSEANHFFKNIGGNNFRNIADSLGISYPYEDNHHAVFSDYDNDGDLDLLIGSNYVPFRLLKNYNGNFSDVTSASGLLLNQGHPRGAVFSDFDNDGDLDLIAQVHTPNRRIALFQNTSGIFSDISSQSNLHNTFVGTSHTLALNDFNFDGKVDVYIGETEGGNSYLYKNTTTSSNHWIKLNLKGTISDSKGTGAKIKLYANNKFQSSQIGTDNSYLSQNSYIQHFGLGGATMVDSIIIEWPSGIRQIKKNVNANQLISISETETSDFFTKITTGSIVNDGGRSFGAAWGDYDNDGNADLFVANVAGGNNLIA